MMKYKVQIITVIAIVLFAIIGAFVYMSTTDNNIFNNSKNDNTTTDKFTEDKKFDRLLFTNIGSSKTGDLYHILITVKNTINKDYTGQNVTLVFLDEEGNVVSEKKLNIPSIEANGEIDVDMIVDEEAYSSANFEIKK